MFTCRVLSGIGLVLALPVAAFGQGAPKPAAIEPIARSAFIATMDGEYRKLDANRDGFATKAEIEADQRRIGIEAATQRARALFAQIDADRDGQVSLAEFVKANTVQNRKIDGAAVMARLDADRDQKVTLIEYRILTLSNFDRLDLDRDGVLTAAEQRAAQGKQ